MQQDLIVAGNSSVEYYYSLNGDIPLVCFHGYGEEAQSFSFLEKALPAGYSLFAINLPFHGNTDWKENDRFTTAQLSTVIQTILTRHFYPLFPTGQPMILAGYSLGGRIALSLYEHSPEKVQKLVLLAPDGLRLNFWYWLATQTQMGNRLFKLTMQHPSWFMGLVRTGNRLGLVNNSIFKFVKYYIHDPEVRQLLYQRWTVLGKCRPDLDKIRKLILKHSTEVRLIYGIHDRIIRSSVGKKFIRGIENQSRLIEIHAGHRVLHEKQVKEILPAFLQ